MLPYECSWAYEEEYRRKHGRNPELLIIGNPPRGRKYKGYSIERSGSDFYVTDPSGHRAFGETPASIKTAKKWIDQSLPSVFERHQLRIARDTLKMHDAMVGVMGGPTKAEAREIIRRHKATYRKNPPRRRYRRNHPLYVRRGKKYIPYDAARFRIAFKRRKSGKSRTARTAVQYAEQRLGRYPMYHGIPDVDAGARKITNRQRGRCAKRRKMPYIKMGGRKLHMTDLVKKYRNMKKAAEVWRGHRHYKAGKVVK